MQKKFYETPEFKELLEEWEQRLAKDGLSDIEKQIGSERKLKQNASNVYRQMDPTRREAKEAYFRELSKCLHSACFDCSVDRVVMVLRAQGAKIVEICAALADLSMKKHRETVRFIIRKYENEWKIRAWEPQELDTNWKQKRATR